MNNESFVARWSRRKRGIADPEADRSDPVRVEKGSDQKEIRSVHEEPPSEQGQTSEPVAPPFDPESLPPIDSITAGSDIRAFLQSGVPAELTKAALRRAWTADPAIRDFIGIAENQWDFTDPSTIPGFGPLRESDDIGRLVAQAMGKLEKAVEPALQNEGPAEPAAPARPPAPVQATAGEHAGDRDAKSPRADTLEVPPAEGERVVAPPQNADAGASLAAERRRRGGHGRALPR
jgi:hypothetical protein